MQNFVLTHLLAILTPLILGPLTFFAGKLVLNLHSKIDGLAPEIKRGVVFVLALGVAYGYQRLGQPVPDACSAVTQGDVTSDCWTAVASPVALRALVAWAVATFMHALQKQGTTA